MMKKSLLFLVAVMLLLGAGACKKVETQVDKLLTFYVADDYSFQLPPVSALLVGQTGDVTFPTNTDATEEYKAANTASNLVKDVTLDELTLAINSPATANFDFLQSVSFYISTDAAGTDKIKMASLTNVPLGANIIRMEPADAKLDKYLAAQNYYLTVEPTFRGGTTQIINMRINYKFKVTADPL